MGVLSFVHFFIFAQFVSLAQVVGYTQIDEMRAVILYVRIEAGANLACGAALKSISVTSLRYTSAHFKRKPAPHKRENKSSARIPVNYAYEHPA